MLLFLVLTIGITCANSVRASAAIAAGLKSLKD
jgi:hypothetical protein